MLQYDLSKTRLAESTERRPAPSEGELLALTVGLLLLHDCSLAELHGRSLELTCTNLDRVAGLIEQRLQPLLRDFDDAQGIRRRLDELVGLTIAAATFPRGGG